MSAAAPAAIIHQQAAKIKEQEVAIQTLTQMLVTAVALPKSK